MIIFYCDIKFIINKMYNILKICYFIYKYCIIYKKISNSINKYHRFIPKFIIYGKIIKFGLILINKLIFLYNYI